MFDRHAAAIHGYIARQLGQSGQGEPGTADRQAPPPRAPAILATAQHPGPGSRQQLLVRRRDRRRKLSLRDRVHAVIFVAGWRSE